MWLQISFQRVAVTVPTHWAGEVCIHFFFFAICACGCTSACVSREGMRVAKVSLNIAYSLPAACPQAHGTSRLPEHAHTLSS